MKAKDLVLNEIITFGDGFIDLHGRRLILHSIDAMAQFRRDLMDMIGPDDCRRVLTRFGYFWGEADAAAMKRIFRWDDLEELLRAGMRFYAIQGAAQTTINALTVDERRRTLDMRVTWHRSGEAEEHLLEIGTTDEPVCWIVTGYASGYASFCLGNDVYFIEEKCRAKKDRVCTATGKDAASWGEDIAPYLEFFRPGDIHGKVVKLSEELKRKTAQLARERERADKIEGAARECFVEVHSRNFRKVIDLAGKVARFDTSVLITGETGTGKEVLAKYIHRLSGRSAGPFVAVNCAALPETLLESELFGHRAGSFTGATEDRIGHFEEAEGGTIFLDEIGDISPATQTKLLRVLQEHQVTRVGESRPCSINVRVLAATNKDLVEQVHEGSFREDLLYRLRVIEIHLPPLRERNEDILPLARHFVGELSRKLGTPKATLDAVCLDYLQSYSWPGNVRELENALERALVLAGKGGTILPEHLPPAVVDGVLQSTRGESGKIKTLDDMELEYIQNILKRTGGNKTRAADILGISPVTLWRKLKKAPKTLPSKGSNAPPTPPSRP